MRLIDADALYEKFKNGENDTEQEKDLNQLGRYLVRHAPSVDAAPVVRCKGCEFWKNDGVHIYGMCTNPNVGSVKLDTDFCSYSERKDDSHE